MQKHAPSPGRLATMVLFALSCFGLLLFLWMSFGGPVPLQPKGYRFDVSFSEATQLANQADVRISGVPVGKVVGIREVDDRTLATIELQSKYAPIRRDARAILRLKTLLGETYVALTPGTPRAPHVPEGGRLPVGQVQSTVELDEVLRAFDARTRDDLKNWVTGWARTLRGRGSDLNDAVGNLAPAVRGGADLLSILDSERHALAAVTRNGGRTFGALGRQQAATRALITAGDRVFATTAARDADLERTLRVLPTFLRELRPTLEVVQATARDAAPVVSALRPVAPLLAPVLRDTSALAPELRTLFRRVDPVVRLSRRALPAATRTVRAARPLMRILWPVARDLVPVADYLGLYKQELIQAWMNVAAATQATFPVPGGEKPVHYLRTIIPLTTEGFVIQDKRLPSNRHNPYLAPLGLEKLGAGGVESFDCSNLGNPQTLPVLPGSVAPCKAQAPTEVQGRRTAFPQLQREPVGRR